MVNSNTNTAFNPIGPVANEVYFDKNELKLELAPISAMVRLQLSGNESTLKNVLSQSKIALPTPGTFAQLGPIRCFWITPKEFVFDSEGENIIGIQSIIDSTLPPSPTNHLITEISDARIVFRVSGAQAEDYLNAGCALDFTLLNFPVGKSTITRFYALPTLIARISDKSFDLIIDRSFAPFMLDRLKDALNECDSA